jgi:hypothetical protein
LGYFESDIQNSIDEARILAEELEESGQCRLEHAQLNKKVVLF